MAVVDREFDTVVDRNLVERDTTLPLSWFNNGLKFVCQASAN